MNALLRPLAAVLVVALVAAAPSVRAAHDGTLRGCPADFEQQLRKLIEDAGGFMHPAMEMRNGDNGRGIFTTQDLKPDDLLFFLPSSLMLRATDDARMQQLYTDALSELPNVARAESHRHCVWYLSLLMLREAFYTENSPLELPFSCFPERTQSSAYWTKEESTFATSIALINARYLWQPLIHPLAQRLHSLLPSYSDIFPNPPAEFEQFKQQVQWSLAMVQTRAYAARRTPDNDDVFAIAPLSDSLNHDEGSPHPTPMWSAQHSPPRRMLGYRHIVGIHRSAGDELFSSYGPLLNDKSVAWYGFFRNDSKYDSIHLALSDSTDRPTVKAAVLAAALNDSVTLTGADLLPNALLIQGRALALTDDELPLVDKLLMGERVSLRNELDALRQLRMLLAKQEKSMAPLLATAQATLQRESAEGRTHSVFALLSRVLIGKCQLLKDAQEAVRQRWMGLLHEADGVEKA